MSESRFSDRRFVLRSLRFHWRSAFSVLLGVMVATAVITGALLVGDSMRGSLRDLTLQRLGKVDFILAPGAFVPQDLADRWEAIATEKNSASSTCAPVLLFPDSMLESVAKDGDAVRRVGQVQVIGCDERFWELDPHSTVTGFSEDAEEVVLNATAAEQLGAKVGDRVTVRLPTELAVPADNPLGRRDTGMTGLPNLRVVAILPDRGFGRFALQPSQQATASVFLPLRLVQETLDRPGQANIFLLSTNHDARASSDEAASLAERWRDALPLTLADFGLRLKQVRRTAGDAKDPDAPPVFEYWSLTSERLILDDAVTDRVLKALGPDRAQGVMTYLANSMVNESKSDAKEVAYSMITGIQDGPGLDLIEAADDMPTDAAAAFLGAEIPSDRVPVVLNAWAAKRLNAETGDQLSIEYFAPETVGGKEVRQTLSAVVAGRVPLTQPSKPYSRRSAAVFSDPPTRFNDPDFTPDVPGVTDQDSILDWDLPFQLEQEKISREDDDYWNQHRLTPKVFLPYEVAQRYFGSRFGHSTSIMIAAGADEASLTNELEAVLGAGRAELGWQIQPVRAMQLRASRGSTPFDVLFLALSFFVIVAAMLLIALLLRLSIEQRATEFGTLHATGWKPKRIQRLLLSEQGMVCAVGGLLGAFAGAGYAAVVIYLLRTWWVGAVTTPFLELHVRPLSLVLGSIGGITIGLLTVYWTVRRLARAAPRRLLGGTIDAAPAGQQQAPSKWSRRVAIVSLMGGLSLVATGAALQGQAQAGAFVAGGMLCLIGCLAAYRVWLTRGIAGGETKLALSGLASRNARRQPLRSVLTAGLIAMAGFLILSMGAFRMDPNLRGAGGFELMATAVQPVYQDLNDPIARRDLLDRDAEALAGCRFLMLRERAGQDASCNNLYQATRPRILGIPDRITNIQEAAGDEAFAWAAGNGPAVWASLAKPAKGTEDDPVPVVIDQNTALWSLQMYRGIGETRAFEYEGLPPLYVRVVGLLGNSVLQGSLLMGEANFTHLFPSVTGYQRMMIQTGATDPDLVARTLESRLADSGVDVQSTRTILSRLLEVQNTYLRTFQGLGALGLLLGTFGLAAAQLRGVLERRGEFALLRAVGFTDRRLTRLVLMETLQLLCGGMLIAVVAAVIALAPYAILGKAHVGWQEPAALLGVVLVVGLMVSAMAARRALVLPLLSSLRGN